MSGFDDITWNTNTGSTGKLFEQLDKGGYEFHQYTYPLNIGSDDDGLGHYILININESKGLGQEISSTAAKVIDENVAFPQVPKRASDPRNGTDSDSIINDLNFAQKQTQRITDSILIYMPNNLSQLYSTRYEHANISVSVATLTETADIDKLKNFDSKILHQSKQIFDESAKKLGLALGKAAQAFLTGDSLLNTLNAKFRRIRNPHMEFLFRAVEPRTFGFEFDFTPKSPEEARNAYAIVQLLKKHQLPELISSETYGVYYKFPSEFDITFMTRGKENKWIGKLSTCALTGLDVSYTGAGQPSFFRDFGEGSPPTHMKVSLTFTELELMTRNRIEQGF